MIDHAPPGPIALHAWSAMPAPARSRREAPSALPCRFGLLQTAAPAAGEGERE